MKKSYLLCFFLVARLMSCSDCYSQIQFQVVLSGSSDDCAYSLIQTSDGGYIAAGSTHSFGAGRNDMYIVKLDSVGTLLWSKTVGGILFEEAYSVIKTTDGGFAVAGFTRLSFGAGQSDMYIIKLDNTGSLQWNKTVGGVEGDAAYSIIQTTDGGFAVAGYTQSFGPGAFLDMYVVKLDSIGSLQWNRTVGGTMGEYAHSIIQTRDHGYAVAGYTNSIGAGGEDMYIVKLDSAGMLQWTRTVGDAYEDHAYSIIQAADGGYVAAGFSNVGSIDADMYIVKLDSVGTLQWNKTLGGTGIDFAYSIIQTADGGYAAAGFAGSFGARSNDIYIVKLDESGNLQWSRTAGGRNVEVAYSIIQTNDGGYAVAGYTNSFGNLDWSNMYIVKFDSNGYTCGPTYSALSIVGTSGTSGTGGEVTSPIPTITSPTSSIGFGGNQVIICAVVGEITKEFELPRDFVLHQNYPNPFNPVTKIKFEIPLTPHSPLEGGQRGVTARLSIYDILGREVATLVHEQLKPGTYEVEWSATGGASDYPSGVYFYKLVAGNYSETKKMVIMK